VIYIDPWKLPPNSPPARLILINHPHYDHLSGGRRAVSTPETVIVATPDCADGLSRSFLLAIPGHELSAEPWKIRAVAAYTIASSFHPKPKTGWGTPSVSEPAWSCTTAGIRISRLRCKG